MISAAAHAYSILVDCPQAGRGFSSTANDCVAALGQRNGLAGSRGDAAGPAENIKCHPFSCKNGRRLRVDHGENVPSIDIRTVRFHRFGPCVRIQHLEAKKPCRQTRHPARFTCNDMRGRP